MTFVKHFAIATVFISILCVDIAAAQSPPDVIGTWEWLESVSGWNTRTPTSTGETRQLEFLADGTVRQFLDEILVNSSTYDLSLYTGSCESVAYICDSSEIWTMPIAILPHTYADDKEICTYIASDVVHLNITDHCAWDGYNHRYEPRGPVFVPIALENTSWGVLKAIYRTGD